MRLARSLAIGAASALLAGAGAEPGPRLLAPGIVSTGDSESHATLSPDGATLLFLKLTPDFAHWTVVSSQRRGAGWRAPRIAWFSGRWDDGDVSFALDGSTIYFVSNRPDDPNGTVRVDFDIFRMRRSSADWSVPERIAELSSTGSEWYPNATADGTLYFGSERRGGNLGPEGTSDLWRARWLGDRFEPPENLGPTINGPGQEIEPWISPDGSLLVFAAKGRAGGLGSYDLFASFRCAGGDWGAPQSLGGGVNSAAWDFGGRFSPDQRTFYFGSNRPRPPDSSVGLVGSAGFAALLARLRAPGNGLFDIYTIETTELGLINNCPRALAQGDRRR